MTHYLNKLSFFLEKSPIATILELANLLRINEEYFRQFDENWGGLLKALYNFYVKKRIYQKHTGLWISMQEKTEV